MNKKGTTLYMCKNERLAPTQKAVATNKVAKDKDVLLDMWQEG
jgi:hypothetical protein